MAFQEGVPRNTPFRVGSLFRSQGSDLFTKAWVGGCPYALTSNRFCCGFLGGGASKEFDLPMKQAKDGRFNKSRDRGLLTKVFFPVTGNIQMAKLYSGSSRQPG